MRSSEPQKHDFTRQKDMYRSLGAGSIRLLRLLPHEDKNASIKCQLFEYPLLELGEGTYLYEALSYVWGDPADRRSISVNEHHFDVTANLHAALSSLRDKFLDRIMWVDTICINQRQNGGQGEKEQQIQLMAVIYSKASRVIVWLGEAEENGDRALEEILPAANDTYTRDLINEPNKQAVFRLLRRPWFQRIWVLQEVAAARSVLIKCGSTEIDGYAFCVGLESKSSKMLEEATPDLQRLICAVNDLIRGAALRRKIVSKTSDRFSLGIRSLGELIDMYHTHKATERHDKIYALLGMSSDALSVAKLEPDYDLPWEELMRRLVKFVLNDHVSVDTMDTKETAIIKSKGIVLGKISKDAGSGSASEQNIEATLRTSPAGEMREKISWLLHNSAKSVQKGDLICLMQGALKPTIIRLQKDHFTIVLIAAELPKETRSKELDVTWSDTARWTHVLGDFVLVWDWRTSSESGCDSDEEDALTSTDSLQSQHAKAKLENDMDKYIQAWNTAQVLGDAAAYSEAEVRTLKAAEGFHAVVREKHAHFLRCQCIRVPLLWAITDGDDALVAILLAKDDIDPNLKDYNGSTPLAWAARNGFEGVVKLLIETGVDADPKSNRRMTPLSLAAEEGHGAVVKLLLDTGKVDAEFNTYYNQTPLSLAAENRHEAVVELLLDTGKVDVDWKNYNNTSPLSLAAMNGHEAVVKLLLQKGKVDADFNTYCSQTPLSLAAENGHEAVVELLLDTGKVDATWSGRYDHTPLSLAAKNGHEAVIKLMLDIGKVDADSHGYYNRTPLWLAAQNGHEAVVKLLLDTGKVDATSEDRYSHTPLSLAAKNGDEAVVKLLLDTGKFDLTSTYRSNRIPVVLAAQYGHDAVVKLLAPFSSREHVLLSRKVSEGLGPVL